MTDEDLVEVAGVSDEKGLLTSGAGSNEPEDVRCCGLWGKHNLSGERPGERSLREGGPWRLAHGEAPGRGMTEELDQDYVVLQG